jgi:hypothetical protein
MAAFSTEAKELQRLDLRRSRPGIQLFGSLLKIIGLGGRALPE